MTKSPKSIFNDLKDKRESYWLKIKEKEILRLFYAASKRVPAYKKFLKKNKINPQKIKTFEEFKQVPFINKNNYLYAYAYKELFWDGNIRKPITIHSTSGSTGEPTYFQREFDSDLKREAIIENFFNYNKITIKGPTLFIITFGMGIWSAGTGIYTAAYLASNFRNIPISIISPGINKLETLKILRNLAPSFKQVIIAGYPPFVKDIVDDALQEKINIKKFNLRFIFTGESFTEEFRDYLSQKAGIKNIFFDTMNTYGTSEFGATAIETPLTILVNRLAQKNKTIFKELFGDATKTPTLTQNIPYFVNFECLNKDLIFTGDNIIPLIRYEPGDHGGIFSFRRMKEIFYNNNIDLEVEFKKVGISNYIYQLPFVYIYERKNLASTFYGILIYPEFIKKALFDKQLSRFLTGKFTMITKNNKRQKQYLEINLELKKNLKLKNHYFDLTLKKIVETLREKSSEYREISDNLKKEVFPKIIFLQYEHPLYFTPGLKQKWVQKK